jgi:hypothetical protein
MRIAPVTAGLLISLCTATAALAQTDPAAPATPAAAPTSSVSTTVPSGAQAKGFSLWGILPWSGIGVGGRFMLPLGIKPILTNTSLHDSFALEFGVDFIHQSVGIDPYTWSWNEIVPVVGIMWNIWVNEHFAFYPKLGVGWAIGWHSTAGTGFAGGYGGYGGFYPEGAGGVLYKLDNGLTLRAEGGYGGLKLGAGWLF